MFLRPSEAAIETDIPNTFVQNAEKTQFNEQSNTKIHEPQCSKKEIEHKHRIARDRLKNFKASNMPKLCTESEIAEKKKMHKKKLKMLKSSLENAQISKNKSIQFSISVQLPKFINFL